MAKEHKFEEFVEARTKKAIPTLPAAFNVYGTVRTDGGWTAITIKVKNEGPQLEVESYSTSNPDTRPLAQEQFKIAVGKAWGRGD